MLGHPYAPAKVMKYKATEKSFVVYFFGDHETAIIPSHYCLGFSEESPNKIISLQQREHLNDAMKVTKVYRTHYATNFRILIWEKLIHRRWPCTSKT